MQKGPHWIRRTHLLRADEYICSACGATFPKPGKNCLRCGAQMGSTKYVPSWVDEAAMLEAIDDDW